MNLKDFFKPTKGKVLLFILIFILIFSFTPCSSTSSWKSDEVRWSVCGPLTKITYLSGQFITDVSILYLGLINLDDNIYLIFIFELVISYIISCIIISFKGGAKK